MVGRVKGSRGLLRSALFTKPSHTYQTERNVPNRTKPTKLYLPNQTYQTEPTKLNLQYQTKLTIENLQNQIKVQHTKACPELGTAQPKLVLKLKSKIVDIINKIGFCGSIDFK